MLLSSFFLLLIVDGIILSGTEIGLLEQMGMDLMPYTVGTFSHTDEIWDHLA